MAISGYAGAISGHSTLTLSDSLLKMIIPHLKYPAKLFNSLCVYHFNNRIPGHCCSKLTTSLVNVFVKISNVNISNMLIFYVEKM